jgi:hypothetical protein
LQERIFLTKEILKIPANPLSIRFPSAQICEKQPNHRAYPHSPINIKTPLDDLHPRKSARTNPTTAPTRIPPSTSKHHSIISIRANLRETTQPPRLPAFPHQHQNTTRLSPSAQICVSIRANLREPTQPPRLPASISEHHTIRANLRFNPRKSARTNPTTALSPSQSASLLFMNICGQTIVSVTILPRMARSTKKEKTTVLPSSGIPLTTDPREFIIIRGARVHNLKNVSVAIPRGKFTVITGLSGSGKSSLAFDTLYAEGQRRYVESLSSYARQFLGRLDKPDVDNIQGISPAVAIEQKVTSRTSRSTVGTSTEIYDYIKLLYARIGRTFSPVSGIEVKRQKVEDVVTFIASHQPESKFLILAPLGKLKDIKKKLDILTQQGFTRIMVKGEMQPIDEYVDRASAKDEINIVIDRVTADPDEENLSRIADST